MGNRLDQKLSSQIMFVVKVVSQLGKSQKMEGELLPHPRQLRPFYMAIYARLAPYTSLRHASQVFAAFKTMSN